MQSGSSASTLFSCGSRGAIDTVQKLPDHRRYRPSVRRPSSVDAIAPTPTVLLHRIETSVRAQKETSTYFETPMISRPQKFNDRRFELLISNLERVRCRIERIVVDPVVMAAAVLFGHPLCAAKTISGPEEPTFKELVCKLG